MKLNQILTEHDLRFKLEYDGLRQEWVATLRNDERSGYMVVIIEEESNRQFAKQASSELPIIVLRNFCIFLQGKTIKDMRGKEIKLPDEIELE